MPHDPGSGVRGLAELPVRLSLVEAGDGALPPLTAVLHQTRLAQRAHVPPVFTAGANVGGVTVTAVGLFRREIAYHGDTLNTAARVQGRCGDLDERLLITDALRARLPERDGDFVPLGRIALRGRDEPAPIFGCDRAMWGSATARAWRLTRTDWMIRGGLAVTTMRTHATDSRRCQTSAPMPRDCAD